MIKMITLGLALLLVAGCNSTGRMELPATTSVSYFDVDSRYLKPIAFDRTISGVKRGTVIGHFPHFTVGVGDPEVTGNLCNNRHVSPSYLEWSSSDRVMGGWAGSTGQIFYDVFSARGFNIVGDPNTIFDHGGDRDKAQLLIGARVIDMRGNFCEDHDIWRGFPLDRYSGVAYTEVEWALYDPLRREQVALFKTSGSGKRKTPSQFGITDAFLDAFAASAEALSANPDFIEAISKSDGGSGQVVSLTPAEGDIITLPKVPLSGGSIAANMPLILPSVVTVSSGGGHGTGFIVSSDGLIITNQHVVGDAENVNVTLSNEITIPATVLRRHELRDVALLKVQISNTRPLPLNPDGIAVAQQVFAIGSPFDPSLRNTVSAGIVSAIRPFEEAGILPLIQADVDIHGGNSGGPLLDASGNVVGVTVSRIGSESAPFSVGLNFFIPIDSALQFLNVKLEQASGT